MIMVSEFIEKRFPNLVPWRTESRAITKLAVPMALTHLAYMAIVTTDVVMMGWLGKDALAAGSLAGNYYWFFEMIILGVLYALSPILAQHIGARRFRMVRPATRQGFWLALILGIPCTAVVWHAGPILVLLGQDADLSENAQAYLRYMVVGLIPGLWYMVLCEFLVAHARPRAPLVVSTLAIFLNGFLDYSLIFGNFGMPRLGLVGAGVASATVSTTMFLAVLVFVLVDRKFRRYRLWGHFWRVDKDQIVEIIRVGTPIALTEVAEMGTFFVAALLMGMIGTDALAAHAIVTQTAGIVLMVPMGLAQAAAVRVGWAVGKGDYGSAARSGWTAVSMSAFFTLVTGAIFLLGGGVIVDFYLDAANPENRIAAELGVTLLAIAAVFMVFDGTQLVGRGSLRGLKDTRVPMQIALGCHWGIGMAAAAYFGVYLGMGAEAVWISMTVSWCLVCVLLLRRFYMTCSEAMTGS